MNIFLFGLMGEEAGIFPVSVAEYNRQPEADDVNSHLSLSFTK